MESGTPTCIGCGASQAKVFLTGPDRMQARSVAYSLWQCEQCKTVFLYPAPSQDRFEQDYPVDYQVYTARQAQSALDRKSLAYGLYKQVRAIIRRTGSTGSAVDIGCGEGGFLGELRAAGWQVTGVERNQLIAVEARQRLNLDIVVADALEIPISSQRFDLITLWDVLEHLPEPRRALAEAARLAKPGAHLVLSTPNLESFEAHWLGRYWAGWDIPRHMWLFPQEVLTRLLEEQGWAVQEVVFLRGRHWLLAQGIRYWVRELSLPVPLKNLFLWIFNSWVMRILLLPYFSLLEKLRTGSIIVYFAQRRDQVDA